MYISMNCRYMIPSDGKAMLLILEIFKPHIEWITPPIDLPTSLLFSIISHLEDHACQNWCKYVTKTKTTCQPWAVFPSVTLIEHCCWRMFIDVTWSDSTILLYISHRILSTWFTTRCPSNLWAETLWTTSRKTRSALTIVSQPFLISQIASSASVQWQVRTLSRLHHLNFMIWHTEQVVHTSLEHNINFACASVWFTLLGPWIPRFLLWIYQSRLECHAIKTVYLVKLNGRVWEKDRGGR